MSNLSEVALLALNFIKSYCIDQHGNSCVEISSIEEEAPPTLERVGSKSFKNKLRGLVYHHSSKLLLESDFKELVEHIYALCEVKGKKIKIENRTLWLDDKTIILDTGRHPIVVSDSGWEVVKLDRAVFLRYPSFENLLSPIKGGDVFKIFEFIRMSNLHDQILFLTALIYALVPGLPHPILSFFGPQGSSKSTAMKIFMKLVDPNKVFDVSASSEADLQSAALQRWVMGLDNLSKISKRLSDFLCKLVTGAGYSRRILYTTDDMLTYNYNRVILLNGICLPQEYPDLLDRSLLIGLERISKEERIDEATLWRNFDATSGEILGGCLDTLSKAMELFPSMPKEFNTRMLDYAQWGCAIAVALGYTKEQFTEAIELNAKRLNEESLDSSPVVAILNFIFSHTPLDILKGTSTDLLKEIKNKAEAAGVDTRALPVSPKMFGRRLSEVKVNLIEDGYQIDFLRTNKRMWTIIPPQYLRDEYKQRTSTLEGIRDTIVATSPTTKKSNFFN